MNHRVVLTDATDGMGRMLATAIHDRGTPIVLIETVGTKDHLRAYRTISTHSDYASLRDAYSSAHTSLGGIDILINVACVNYAATLPVTRREQVHSHFATHLGDVALCCSIGMGFLSDRARPARLMNIWLISDTAGPPHDAAWHRNTCSLIATYTEFLTHAHAQTGTMVTSFVQHITSTRDTPKDTQAIHAWIQALTTGTIDGHSGQVITVGQRATARM
jgi:NAD(P)-dependent dehydrogenase (short-subunit alcohol dehydrogenase family)